MGSIISFYPYCPFKELSIISRLLEAIIMTFMMAMMVVITMMMMMMIVLSMVVIPAIKRTLDEPLTFSRCRSKPVEHLIASIMCLANSAPFLVVAIFAAPLNGSLSN